MGKERYSMRRRRQEAGGRRQEAGGRRQEEEAGGTRRPWRESWLGKKEARGAVPFSNFFKLFEHHHDISFGLWRGDHVG